MSNRSSTSHDIAWSNCRSTSWISRLLRFFLASQGSGTTSKCRVHAKWGRLLIFEDRKFVSRVEVNRVYNWKRVSERERERKREREREIPQNVEINSNKYLYECSKPQYTGQNIITPFCAYFSSLPFPPELHKFSPGTLTLLTKTGRSGVKCEKSKH